MHVVVLGSGIIGTSSAFYLRQAGCQVTVIDKNSGPGLGASFANAGAMTASRAGPWASPRMIHKALAGYFYRDSAFRMTMQPDLDQIRWLLGFLFAAYYSPTSAKRATMVALALETLLERKRLDAELGMDYGSIHRGLLSVYRTGEDFDNAMKDADTLREAGIEVKSLDRNDLAQVEPAVDWQRIDFAGVTLAENDETADCFRFCQALDRVNEQAGVVRLFGEPVTSFDASRLGHCVVKTASRELRADAVVLAAGIETLALAKTHNVRLPIYPVKGYSMTLAPAETPTLSVAIADEKRKVFLSPFNGGLRAAGVADISGYDRSVKGRRLELINRAVEEFLPAMASATRQNVWSDLRPMTYDGPPIVCGIPGSGLWVNTGHGSLGWTLCLASAKLIAQLVRENRDAPPNTHLGLNHR